MTIVRVRFTPNGVPTPGRIRFQARHDKDTRPIVSGRDIFNGPAVWEDVPVEGAEIEVRPQDAGWHYVVRAQADGGPMLSSTVLIPQNGPVDFEALVRYDPKAGMAYEPDPDWYAHLNSIENGIAGTQAALSEAVTTAQNAATTAADTIRGEVSADAVTASTAASSAANVASDLEQIFLGGTEAVNDAAVETFVKTDGTGTNEAVNVIAAGSPASLTPIPGYLNNEWRYQQSSYSQDNIVTVGDVQYAVWIDDQIHPVVGKRAAGSQTWDETYDLRNIVGDPFKDQAPDGHNTFVLGVDPQGIIHVSGNMHGDALRYARTTSAGDISAWTTPGMIGIENEGGVTYPQFFNAANGDLFFIYRNGGSGNGDTVLNRRVGGMWQRVAILINGFVTNQNAYTNRVGIGPDGSIHLMFMWRDEGQASTNADICYTYSEDGGVTWKRTDGSAQTVPITRENAEVVVNVEHNSGIVNQSGMDVDRDGNPHGAFMMYDAAGNTQYFHTWHDGTTWHHDQVTDFTTRVETLAVFTLNLTTARPQIICTDNGRTYVLGMTQGDGWGGSAIIVDVTPGSGNPIAKLFDMNLQRWEPAYDQRALKERGELNILVTPYLSPAPANSVYKKQRGWILTVPTKSLQRFFGVGFNTPNAAEAFRASGTLAAGESLARTAGRGDIPSQADLDNYYLPEHEGLYWIPGPGRAMFNVPPGIKVHTSNTTAMNAWVRVETILPSYSMQTVYAVDGSYVQQRLRSAGEWGAWRLIAGNNGFVLDSGVDLFTVANGTYHLQSASVHPNEPSVFAGLNTSGTLEVIGNSSVIRSAILTTLDRTARWEATSVNGTWGSWTQVRGGGGALASETNLFTLPNGSYHLQSSATYPNEPAAFATLGVAGTLDIRAYSSVIRGATLTTLDRSKSWEIISTNGTWGSWVQVRGA